MGYSGYIHTEGKQMTTQTATATLAQLFAAADAIGNKYQASEFDQALAAGDLDEAISLAMVGADEAKELATMAINRINADHTAITATTEAILAKYPLL
jgi:hypothetical protein